MTKILMRAAKSPFTTLSPEASLEGFGGGMWGSNVGNLIFGDSVHRLLSTPDVEVVTNGFLTERPRTDRAYFKRINDEFDHFVIPLANAFRKSFHKNLTFLTDAIEKLDIPVTVVGVGVAGGVGSLDKPMPNIDGEVLETVHRFIRATLDRSASIGVRGSYTAEYLKSLGYGDEHVRVIGCPSLFKFGPELSIEEKVASLDADSAVTLNLTPYVPAMGKISLHNTEQYRNLTYIPQTSNDLAMLMWGKAQKAYTNPDLPANVRHPLYVQDKIRFFTDGRPWTEYLATRDFAFGSRIHGNIAALISGTPAYVIAHDARTLELAEYHCIPHSKVPDLAGRLDASEFYDMADYSAFNAQHAQLFDRFDAFMRENGLAHVYQEGKANPAYDDKLAQVEFPAPVRALTSVDPVAQRASYDRIVAAQGSGFKRKMKQQALETYELPSSLGTKFLPKVLGSSPVQKVLRRVEKYTN